MAAQMQILRKNNRLRNVQEKPQKEPRVYLAQAYLYGCQVAGS
jgi:hypothetical protein